jgi:molecular chaperone GrpE
MKEVNNQQETFENVDEDSSAVENAASGESDTTSAASQEEPSIEEQLQRYRELALRAQADLDNYRKRMVREKEESIRYANASLLERLLPVLDSFELGLQAARQVPEAAPIVQGFAMVEKQLVDFLRENGVEPVDAVGKEFDPNMHEAVSQQHHEEIDEGKVSHQLRKGYKLRDRLLRPSTVIVSKGPGGGAEEGGQPS